ncbi:MAG: conjugal transfer protein TraD [Pseudomonadota bacterium]
MRKPRDIDAELKALQEKAKGLKARKVSQHGELVAATGADQLDPDTLAGVLLAAVETKDAAQREAWRKRGSAFFQGRSGKSAGSADHNGARPGADGGAHAPG